MNTTTEQPPQAIPSESTDKQLELIRARCEADFALTPAGQELRLMQARQEADFALTPVGQELKRFQTNQRMGMMYAQSTIVPDSYKNNVPNCAIAIDMATRMGANALMVMQNLYMVHGNPSWSTKFLIATINTCGRFTPLRYESNGLDGDDYGWRCYAYEASDRDRTERLEGTWVTWRMVKAEGWDQKKGSKWNTMPEQMFRYRAAAFWQRMYAPEISMGFSTVEEMQDIVDVPYTDISPNPSSPHRKSISDLARDNARATMTVAPVETVDTETGEVTTPTVAKPADPADDLPDDFFNSVSSDPSIPEDGQ